MAPVQNKEDALRLREEKIKDALRAIDEGMAIRTAGRRFGISESTLRTQIKLAREDVKWGKETLFIRSQEELLADYCIKMAHLG